MKSRLHRPTALAASALALLGLSGFAVPEVRAETVESLGHVHGLLTQRGGRLLLATHRGLVALDRSGAVERVSTSQDDFMALTPLHTEPDTLLASGHPATGGNLGLVRSTDGGRSWEKWSDGLQGPADFHLLAVSAADPSHVYGVHQGLQHSADGGKTWRISGQLPERTFSLSGSAVSASRLYAAAESGLYASDDAGASWRPLKQPKLPATLVQVTGGKLYAFVAGEGLLVADEATQTWQPLFDGFGGHLPVQISADPGEGRVLHLLDQVGSLWRSEDGGRTWAYYLDADPLGTLEQAGKKRYEELCIACHGKEGVGESYTAQSLFDRNYLSAPALDGSAHAWHHDDDQLVAMILEGLPRQSRMPAWKGTLDEPAARAIVAYMKSLWGPRELHCQGAKHMNCDYRPY